MPSPPCSPIPRRAEPHPDFAALILSFETSSSEESARGFSGWRSARESLEGQEEEGELAAEADLTAAPSSGDTPPIAPEIRTISPSPLRAAGTRSLTHSERSSEGRSTPLRPPSERGAVSGDSQTGREGRHVSTGSVESSGSIAASQGPVLRKSSRIRRNLS